MGEGPTAESLISSIFADPIIKFIHAHNVHGGCFHVRHHPADEADPATAG
jgi:hypothetical protein